MNRAHNHMISRAAGRMYKEMNTVEVACLEIIILGAPIFMCGPFLIAFLRCRRTQCCDAEGPHNAIEPLKMRTPHPDDAIKPLKMRKPQPDDAIKLQNAKTQPW